MSGGRTVKIIGGPHDGQMIGIGLKQRDIAVYDPQQPLPVTALDPSKMPETIPAPTRTFYTLRSFNGPCGERLEFLSPADWSDWQAIEHQFLK